MNPTLPCRRAFPLLTILGLFAAACVFPGQLRAQVNYVERVLLPAGHQNVLRESMEPLQTENPLYDPALDGHVFKVITTKQIYYATSFSPGIVFFPLDVPFQSDVSLGNFSATVETNRQLDHNPPSDSDDNLLMFGSRSSLYHYDFDTRVRLSTITMINSGVTPTIPITLAVGQGLYMFGFGNNVYVLPPASYQVFSGAFTFMFGGTGTGNGQFTNLTSMAFGPGPNGLFYCLDLVPAPGIPRVEVFDLTDPNGNYFRYSFNLPAGLATTSATDLGFAINDVGHMFVGDGQGGGVEMDLSGNVICTFDPPVDDVPDPNAYAGTGTGFGNDGVTFGGPGNGPGDASYITFDAAGDVFVENNANGLHRYLDTQAVPPTNVVQTISAFPMIASHTSTDAPFTITPPTSSSRLPVTVKVFSGPATISGLTVTLTGVGTVVLAADQTGNAYYGAAPEVKVAFKVIAAKK